MDIDYCVGKVVIDARRELLRWLLEKLEILFRERPITFNAKDGKDKPIIIKHLHSKETCIPIAKNSTKVIAA